MSISQITTKKCGKTSNLQPQRLSRRASQLRHGQQCGYCSKTRPWCVYRIARTCTINTKYLGTL